MELAGGWGGVEARNTNEHSGLTSPVSPEARLLLIGFQGGLYITGSEICSFGSQEDEQG